MEEIAAGDIVSLKNNQSMTATVVSVTQVGPGEPFITLDQPLDGFKTWNPSALAVVKKAAP